MQSQIFSVFNSFNNDQMLSISIESKSLGNGFLRVRNTMKQVLVKLFVRRFSIHHLKSRLQVTIESDIIESDIIVFKFLPFVKRPVSSANSLEMLLPTATLRSLIYIKNNTGPRTEPWGTPQFILFTVDFSLLIIVYCCLPDRQDLKKVLVWPLIPQFSRFFNSI